MGKSEAGEVAVMKCSYVRQTSEFSQFCYLKGPAEFDTFPDGQKYYKNIIFLTDPSGTEREFYVQSVGYEVSDPCKNLINRLYPTDMIIHYIVGGHGSFNGRPIGKGDCVVAARNKPHTLRTDPEDTMEFFWIMLRMQKPVDTTAWGIPENAEIFPYEFEDGMRKIFDEMLHFEGGDRSPYWFFMGKLYELISYHTRVKQTELPQERPSSRFDHYISFAKRMWEQTNYQISVEDVARSLGFSRKYFSLIFQSRTGVSPQTYVVERRIRMAKIRIDAGEGNLKTLAIQLGYSDYSSFSRAFKRAVGIGPREYMQQAMSGNGHATESGGVSKKQVACRNEEGAGQT